MSPTVSVLNWHVDPPAYKDPSFASPEICPAVSLIYFAGAVVAPGK